MGLNAGQQPRFPAVFGSSSVSPDEPCMDATGAQEGGGGGCRGFAGMPGISDCPPLSLQLSPVNERGVWSEGP